MNEKLTEEKWNEKRKLSKALLESINKTIENAIDLNVLTGAEADYCYLIKFNLNNRILNYWSERSKVSLQRFVEGDKNEESKEDKLSYS